MCSFIVSLSAGEPSAVDSAIRTAEAKNEVCRGGTTIHITRCQGATASGGMRRQKALIEAGSVGTTTPPLEFIA